MSSAPVIFPSFWKYWAGCYMMKRSFWRYIFSKEGKMENEISDPNRIIGELMEYGKMFADSGMFPDVKSAAQGAVKILAGKELGFSPMQAINSFYFVNGKLAMLTQAMAALIKKSDKYDYQILTQTSEGCVIAFFEIKKE